MYEPGEAAVADLHMDLRNPRVPNEEFTDEDKALEYLVDHADVNELVQSIGRSGWLNFEPLIVLKGDNTVIEGNRRLAALRLISDPKVRDAIGYRLPSGVENVSLPKSVQVVYVDNRSDARDFIGFKHINGAYKWDSFAKAKYAAEWLGDDSSVTVRDISERLGDSHNTVLRLINGYRVLQQAERLGFSVEDITAPRGFSFSHLYTALPSPSVRSFLGINAGNTEVLPAEPVPKAYHDQLLEYLTWLYGQEGRGENVVASQNPDLGRLTKVIANNSAIGMLRSSKNLSEAFDLVEDKGKAFEGAVFKLLTAAREASAQVGKFDGDAEVLQVVVTVNQTVKSMVAGMKVVVDEKASEGGSSKS